MNTEFKPEDYMPFAPPLELPLAARDPSLPVEQAGNRQPHLGYTLLLLLAGVIALLVFGLGVTAAGVSMHLLPKDPAQLTRGFPKTNILIELLTFAATFAFAFLVFPSMWHSGFGDTIQWHKQTALRFLGWLAAGGVTLSIVAQLLESRLHLDKKMPIDDFFQHPSDVWMVALFGTLVAPACEEIFFRGFLLRGLAIAWDWAAGPLTRLRVRMTGTLTDDTPEAQPGSLSRTAWIVAGVISSGLFAIMHAKQLGFAWSAVGVLWLVGGVLTTVRIRLNSVAASTVIHMVYNGWIFVIIFFVTDGFRHLDKVAR